MEDETFAFHVVITTHNSRVSNRMITYGIQKQPALTLSLTDEIFITNTIRNVIIDSKMKCLAYNICADHFHIILVSSHSQLSQNVQKIKSISSKFFNRFKYKQPQKVVRHLWSQKYYHTEMNPFSLSTLSKKVGYLNDDQYLGKAIEYIRLNREKHNLEESEKLKNTISEFTIDINEAFECQ